MLDRAQTAPHSRVMKIDWPIKAAVLGPPANGVVFGSLCGALVLAAYAVVFYVARDFTVLQALIGGAANAFPTTLFGLAAYWVVRIYLVDQPLLVQIGGHAVTGALFSVLTYWLITVMLGVAGAASVVEFSVRPFPHPASAWQLLQNLTTYGIIATLAYLHTRPESATIALPGAGAPSQPLSRYFIKSGDDFVPMDVDKIVSIAGADDYSEVATLEGKHLARMTLTEFEQALDTGRFIRVHRSRIINVQYVRRAEPAGGGRLLVHMENGESIPASRSGSKRLRDLLI